MERRSEEESGTSTELSVVDAVRIIAAYNARAELDTEHQMLLFLQSWWSSTYTRPLKDPILLSYTLEELLYEFYDKIERRKVQEERVDGDADKIEVAKEKADLDWAELEERRELEAEKAKQTAASLKKEEPPLDPTKDPANIKWMEEQLAKAKVVHGDTFGEDIDVSFEE